MKDGEDILIFNVIKSARIVQDFLWGESNGEWGLDEWRRMFRKRVQKIDDIDPDNPHAIVELRKRLLQNAALSIALLAIIDDEKKLAECNPDIVSNLPEYK